MLLNKIKAKIIAGAANNQLANEDVHGAILQERGYYTLRFSCRWYH
jgi:glutamate dehydrogenase/leucine dehydrogenase